MNFFFFRNCQAFLCSKLLHKFFSLDYIEGNKIYYMRQEKIKRIFAHEEKSKKKAKKLLRVPS